MTTAREIMTKGAECVGSKETVLDAAKKMAELGVGALPICGPDNKLKGVVTDRDLAIKVMAQGRGYDFPAGDLNQNEAVTIGADDSVDDVLTTMTEHRVRRLPVIDGDQLVGMVAMADVARALPEPQVGDLVNALAADY